MFGYGNGKGRGWRRGSRRRGFGRMARGWDTWETPNEPTAPLGYGFGLGFRWQAEAQTLPPEERKSYLEAFKSHLETRLEEVNKALEALASENE